MDYIYDIVLNFNDDYYEFYEWKQEDKINNIKKIPIYKIPTNKYLDIKNNHVTIDQSSLPHTSKMFLLTNGIEIIGILTNKQGKVIKKSSLIFEESDDILEDKELIKNINIKYTVDKINKSYYLGRIVKEKEKYINNYLKKINKLEDEYLLKYLYYDIYNIDEVNIDKIYNNLINLTKKDINKIYECIKRVELELKQQ